VKNELINRFADLFNERSEKFTIFNNTLFKPYNGMVVPFAPANENVNISNHNAQELLSQLGGKLVRWTDGEFVFSGTQEWYAVVCRKFTSIDSVKSKLRNELGKGISNCIVERVDAKYLGRLGYDVYYKACAKYKLSNVNYIDEKTYSKYTLAGYNYNDILHYWGVFHKGKMIAYSTNYIFGQTEALYTSIKIDPAYLNVFPLYALIYVMNRYYLLENTFEYVNDGYRTLLHDTNIQNFLIKKFNFVKAGLTLKVYYKSMYYKIIKVIYPLREIVGIIDPRLKAILELERIRRSYYGPSLQV
jgi:hypothetical protein